MLVRKLFSKTWQLREEALNDIEDEVINQNKHRPDEAFVASIGAVNFTIGDKMAGVAQRAMNLLATVCNSFQDVNVGGGYRNAFNGWSDNIMSVLTEKIGDNL